jgi:hypothetical protein
MALMNADNFEFFIERHNPPSPPAKKPAKPKAVPKHPG